MKAVIFDVDGTIADSFDFVVDFLAEQAGEPPLSQAARKPLRNLSMTAIAQHLGISMWRLPRLFYKGRRAMHASAGNILPFAGMPEVIKAIHGRGYRLFVVSSNNASNVKAMLREADIHEYFTEVQ